MIFQGEKMMKIMVENSNYYHLEYESQANKIHKSERQKRPPLTEKNDL
jgi:hypothetical protein